MLWLSAHSSNLAHRRLSCAWYTGPGKYPSTT